MEDIIATGGWSLSAEYDAYTKVKGIRGTPTIHLYDDEDGNDFSILILDLLGLSLADLLAFVGQESSGSGGKFSPKTILMIADQLLRRLRSIHHRGIIHRDIKPDNIAIGLGNEQNRLYVFDLGIA